MQYLRRFHIAHLSAVVLKVSLIHLTPQKSGLLRIVFGFIWPSAVISVLNLAEGVKGHATVAAEPRCYTERDFLYAYDNGKYLEKQLQIHIHCCVSG